MNATGRQKAWAVITADFLFDEIDEFEHEVHTVEVVTFSHPSENPQRIMFDARARARPKVLSFDQVYARLKRSFNFILQNEELKPTQAIWPDFTHKVYIRCRTRFVARDRTEQVKRADPPGAQFRLHRT